MTPSSALAKFTWYLADLPPANFGAMSERGTDPIPVSPDLS